MFDELHKLELNFDTGKLIINGNKLTDVSYLKLEFDGSFKLTITEEYFVNGKKKNAWKGRRKNYGMNFDIRSSTSERPFLNLFSIYTIVESRISKSPPI